MRLSRPVSSHKKLYLFSEICEALPEALWPTQGETVVFGLARRGTITLLVRCSSVFRRCNKCTCQAAGNKSLEWNEKIHSTRN